MTRKKWVLIISSTIIVIVALLIIAGVVNKHGQQENGDYQNCDALLPTEVSMDLFRSDYYDSAFLDLNEKGEIAPGKYGFVKKLDVDTEMYITQTLSYGHEAKHIVYGIYYDKDLEEPVEQVQLKDNFIADIADEYRIRLETSDGVSVLLDPGEYYLAVYTTKKNDDFELEYSAWCGYTQRNYELKPNEILTYTAVEDHQINQFKINPPGTCKMIVVDINNHCAEVQLIDENGNVINQQYGTIYTLDGEYKNQTCFAEFDVVGGNEYTLKVISSEKADLTPNYSAWEPMTIEWGYKAGE